MKENQKAKNIIIKRVNQKLTNESEEVKKYIIDIIYLFFTDLEHETHKHPTKENLNYSLSANLGEELTELLREAREQTKKGK